MLVVVLKVAVGCCVEVCCWLLCWILLLVVVLKFVVGCCVEVCCRLLCRSLSLSATSDASTRAFAIASDFLRFPALDLYSSQCLWPPPPIGVDVVTTPAPSSSSIITSPSRPGIAFVKGRLRVTEHVAVHSDCAPNGSGSANRDACSVRTHPRVRNALKLKKKWGN